MIPFNRPYLTGNEINYIQDAHKRGQLAGDGHYTKLCHQWFEARFQNSKALLTHSCTAALEIAALLLDLQPGDEVIMPSYTFVSTANAFVLRGAIPVFIDINPDTLNINEFLIESAITARTKAVVVVHYAGVACNMDYILDIAKKYNLLVVEDAAQAIESYYQVYPLGGLGDISCFSFHETKNIICGEGGAILVNNPGLQLRAEILREKGTNRTSFFRGEVSKYTWVDIGSSYLPGELNAAFLFAQLQQASWITTQRLQIWNTYHSELKQICALSGILQPRLLTDTRHNGHIYYLIFAGIQDRNRFIHLMRDHGVHCVFHYIPLHNSPAGLCFSREGSSMEHTVSISNSIVRLPLFIGVDVEKVISAAKQCIMQISQSHSEYS